MASFTSRLTPVTEQKGLTIVELMITLTILSVLILFVGPSAQNILISNKIASEVNQTSAILRYARHNSIDEGVDTLVCPTKDYATCTETWNDAKMMFADLNGNGARSSDEPIIQSFEGSDSTSIISGPKTPIRFQENGSVSSMATILVCHKDKDVKFARALTISLQGRIKTSQDNSGDGVHENNSGTALSCS